MNPAKLLGNAVGVIAGAATAVLLFGCMVYDNGGGYGGAAGAGYVEVGADSDFYEPLSPYGRWEVVGSYGRCWVPGGVGSDWSPYTEGEWVSTDDGWYFESDEPWGWATYHYGRWVEAPSFGWCWIPGTEWGPAWVSWWEGDGYIGWAPLGPGDRFEHGRFEGRRPRDRDTVFVEERRFTERIRPTTVVRNNPTVFNRTTNITNVRVVNNVTINAGPHRENIERASGHTLRTVPAGDMRRQHEAPVLQRSHQQRPVGGRNVEPARGAPPRAGAVAPAVPQPVAPTSNRPPAATHRENVPVQHPAPTVAPAPTVKPGSEGNAHGGHARPVENGPSRVVTPSGNTSAPAPRVAPTHPPAGQSAAPTHVSQPVKPATAPNAHPASNAQPAPKGEGSRNDHGERRNDDQEKPRQQQAN